MNGERDKPTLAGVSCHAKAQESTAQGGGGEGVVDSRYMSKLKPELCRRGNTKGGKGEGDKTHIQTYPPNRGGKEREEE